MFTTHHDSNKHHPSLRTLSTHHHTPTAESLHEIDDPVDRRNSNTNRRLAPTLLSCGTINHNPRELKKDKYDTMGFFSGARRPSLTPLGLRLMAASEDKLVSLETPSGGREEGTALWKEVLVRAALRSAWSGVGLASEPLKRESAVLAVVVEEEEEESEKDEEGDARWFDDFLDTMADEDEGVHQPTIVRSNEGAYALVAPSRDNWEITVSAALDLSDGEEDDDLNEPAPTSRLPVAPILRPLRDVAAEDLAIPTISLDVSDCVDLRTTLRRSWSSSSVSSIGSEDSDGSSDSSDILRTPEASFHDLIAGWASGVQGGYAKEEEIEEALAGREGGLVA